MEQSLAEYLAHAPIFLRRLGGEIVYWTAGAEELYGFDSTEAVGRNSYELLNTKFPHPRDSIDRRLLDAGEWRGRLAHTAKDGREVWTESHWRVRAPGMVVAHDIDISERIEFERQRKVLSLELDHRVKNTLAVVQALARLTFKKSELDHVRQFEERLLAISEVHDLLTLDHWDQAQLKSIIRAVSGGLHAQSRITAEGPDVSLRPDAAVSYALAFHELCTNAVKHGALNTHQGRVYITWTVDPASEGRFHLTWREVGGGKVVAPEQEGLGSNLIRRVIASQLGGPLEMRFEEAGFVCEFSGLAHRQHSPSKVA